MTMWTIYLVILHLMAILGLFLTACIAGRVIRNGNDAPEPIEHPLPEETRTTIYSPPSYHLRSVK